MNGRAIAGSESSLENRKKKRIGVYMPLLLLGFMGVGKTTIGKLLDRPVYDMDNILEERTGMPIVTFFERYGEAAFRTLEADLLQELLLLPNDCLISTGGGIVTLPENRIRLAENKSNNILLTASFEVLYHRIRSDSKTFRPIYMTRTKQELKELYQERDSLYRGLAGTIIHTDSLSPTQIAQKISGQLSRSSSV